MLQEHLSALGPASHSAGPWGRRRRRRVSQVIAAKLDTSAGMEPWQGFGFPRSAPQVVGSGCSAPARSQGWWESERSSRGTVQTSEAAACACAEDGGAV